MDRGDICSGAQVHVQQGEDTRETVADMRAPHGLGCSSLLISDFVILGQLLLNFILVIQGHLT